MAAKRSPILGYNHNVKYRGVVFHVQTEDSGLMNPHLFTHLFHEGVIVSTRKLVYDAGSNEEAIKALMQAQHKAVMKDLMKGTFDEKIDQYLGEVEGLTPRQGGAAKAAALAAQAVAAPVVVPVEARAPTEQAPELTGSRAPTEMSAAPFEVTNEDLSEPIELPLKKGRVDTGDRTRPIEKLPVDEENAPTLGDAGAAELAAAFQAVQAKAKQEGAEQPVKSRTGTAPRVSRLGGVGKPEPTLEIIDDEPSGRGRAPRDTTVELADGVPSRTTQDSIPPLTTPVRTSTPPSHGASALPPMKAPTNRPSLSPPVVARQPTPEGTEPPGERSERPGQYSVSRKTGDVPLREQTGRIAAINPGTLRSGQPGSGPHNAPTIPREPTPQTSIRSPSQHPQSSPQTPVRSPSQRPVTPRGNPPAHPVTPVGTTTPIRGVPLVQAGRPHVTAPIQNRAPTPANPPSGSGVVMTRPAVIVGAPPKTPQIAQTTTGRIRKAREDEGRGFGQGLISEKSLDEVILAYLSEDAEDK